MIIHLVFFKMLPEAEGATGEENAKKLVEMIRQLPSAIPEVLELEIGHDISNSPASYEVGLLSKFQTKEDLDTYRVHPAHQEVVAFIQKTTSERAVVDYEI